MGSFSRLHKALSWVVASRVFSHIVLGVREWGNHLNNTKIVWYEFASLRKLRDVKSCEVQGLTLLHYLAAVLKQRMPWSGSELVEMSRWVRTLVPWLRSD